MLDVDGFDDRVPGSMPVRFRHPWIVSMAVYAVILVASGIGVAAWMSVTGEPLTP